LKLIEIAEQAAHVGAEVLLAYWQELGTEDADVKARNDWVSRADRESEAAIKSYLADICPGDAVLGEESGMTAGKASKATNRVWVIDPLDGTSNYLQHFPFWSISVAVKAGDEMVAGVVYEPLRELVFAAEKGAGAFRDGERMQVSSMETVDGSFLATGFPFRAQSHVNTYCAILADVMRAAKGIRRAGSAALDLAYTAAGVFDGFFEMHLAPWDVAAGSLLVREAGGIVTDFSGGERFWERGNIIGAAPKVHAELLALANKHAREDQMDS
jgi:myo-inositol-1(or 4)-monophosphatase